VLGQTEYLNFSRSLTPAPRNCPIWNFYFEIFEKAAGKEESVLFLAHVRPDSPGNRLGPAARAQQPARE